MNERGLVKLLVILAILIGFGYTGASFGKPYFKYFRFRADAKEILSMGLDEDKLRAKLLNLAIDLKIPLRQDNIFIEKRTAIEEKVYIMKVKARWSEKVDLFGLYQKRLEFKLEEEGKYMKDYEKSIGREGR
ncbi:MAG: hypothetical protein HZA07_01550 [Nitrospirae bacterium]|nr:hypothetical protein [Nitrospirota bacterium]